MIGIIDYGVGNVGSILNILKHIGVDALLAKTPSDIEKATKLILPGVGSFDYGMTLLNESGLREVVDKKVISDGFPALGICLGMQMMTTGSEEGTLGGLNWINGNCIRFRFAEDLRGIRIPHMGWNDVYLQKDKDLFFPKINDELQFYFAHSYHLVCSDEIVTATCKYGYEFPVAFRKDNIFGAQFHPEKSHQFGMNFLKAFATYDTEH